MEGNFFVDLIVDSAFEHSAANATFAALLTGKNTNLNHHMLSFRA
jgi:hypothetical protein